MSGSAVPPPPIDPDVEDLRPLHLRWPAIGLVVIGGFIGTGARYLGEQVLPRAKTGVPWATLIINLVGAFILGTLLQALLRLGPDIGARRRIRLLVGTGFCGALTTYSSLATETVELWTVAHRTGAGIGYAVGTVLAGLVCVWVGFVVADRLTRGSAR